MFSNFNTEPKYLKEQNVCVAGGGRVRIQAQNPCFSGKVLEDHTLWFVNPCLGFGIKEAILLMSEWDICVVGSVCGDLITRAAKSRCRVSRGALSFARVCPLMMPSLSLSKHYLTSNNVSSLPSPQRKH